ncbi:PA4642 family protein [Cellvibrio sp. pealriver]|uniref:PA4642 family protein n=1 Tax=Cellvibrio sp. pealriver TaxID=1622269 RepID=UPI00066FDF0C|nr:PA4642 family protein [Cellvibrio sp. pealriver]
MSLRKDKEKVLGETFDDERIKTFLNYPAPAGVNADYHLLEKAYRGMLGGNFATFVKFFVEAGKDLNAIGPEGKTFLQVVKAHRNGEEYAIALEAAGAK